MGSSQSKGSGATAGAGGRDESSASASASATVYPTDPTNQGATSVEISPDLLNNLRRSSDKKAAAAAARSGDGRKETKRENLQTLDAQVKERIESELRRLRQGEEEVKKEIERALAKENIDREKNEGSRSSVILERDLEEIQKKIQRQQSRSIPSHVQEARDDLVKCYQAHKATSTTLDCWDKVIAFKTVVGRMEKESLQQR